MLHTSNIKPIPLGEGQSRYIKKYRWDPTPQDGPLGQNAVRQLMQSLIDNNLLVCGPRQFQTLRMQYTGDCWEIVLEAVADDGTQDT